MFALPHHPYPTPYHVYNPYEQLLIEQELRRRQQLEAYRRRQQEIEVLNRRRQYERALRQAELERRQQMAMAAEQERRRPAMSNGMEDLLEMLYGGRVVPSPSCRRRSPTPERGPSQEPSVEQLGVPQRAQETSLGAAPSTEPTEHSETTATASTIEPEITNADSPETSSSLTSSSFAAVDGILSMFASLKSEFTFPTQLDFLASSSSSSPKLAYTSNNAPLHQYEHVLTGLLTRLDAVESYGDDEVRKARKEAVKGIEKELAGLDERKTEEWQRQNVPEAEQGTQEVESSETQDEAIAIEVDASVVPLPDDSEDHFEANGVPQAFAAASPAMALSSNNTNPQGDHNDEHEHDANEASEAAPVSLVGGPLSASQFSDHTEVLPTIRTPVDEVSLGEASSSDESDSEVEEYVDVEADVMSGTEMSDDSDEIEEAEVEGANELVGMDEWEMDF